MVKKIKPLILVSLLLAGGLFVCFFFYSKFNGEKLNDSLLVRYPDGFITKAVKIDDSLIALSIDNTEWDYADCPSYIQPPVVQLLRGVSSSYEISFDPFLTFNERFDSFDVDGDGRNEIVSEWVGHACGSGSLRGLIIWKLDSQKKLIPFAGYPQEESGESTFIVKNLKNDEVSNFPVTVGDCFTDYQLSPSHFDLFLGCPVWNFKVDECHECPHIWKLQVYKFENNAFIKNESWNNGEDYLTEEKIDQPWNEDFKKIREIFNSLWNEEN